MPSPPEIDRARCTGCESCIEVCPEVFRRNPQTGDIEVVDLDEYPAEKIEEAVKMCPGECILINAP